MFTVAKLVLFGAIAAAIFFTIATAQEGQNEIAEASGAPPLRAIPGITSDDQFPTACVGCHVNYEDMNLDARLSTVMARWSKRVDAEYLQIAQSLVGPNIILTGVHPKVDVAHQYIPAVCLNCHERRADNPMPLVPFLHKVHLNAEGKAVFLSIFQGECTHCHKLDKATGQWSVPNAAEEETAAVE